MKKNILVLMLAVSLLIVVVGCSEKTADTQENIKQDEIITENSNKNQPNELTAEKSNDEPKDEISEVVEEQQLKKVNDNKEVNKQKETQEVKQQTEETTEAENEEKKLNPYDYERINQEGAISMSFIFADPLGEGKEGYLTFVGQLDNHSYNLDEYDLSEYITLIDDKGNSPEGNPKWELYSGGGHHIINYLLFPDDGFITSETEYIKLVIKDFIDVPIREFVWEKEFLGKTK